MSEQIITHEQAKIAAQRLINSFFGREPKAKANIPALPNEDADLVITAYIRQQSKRIHDEPKEALSADAAFEKMWAEIGDGNLLQYIKDLTLRFWNARGEWEAGK